MRQRGGTLCRALRLYRRPLSSKSASLSVQLRLMKAGLSVPYEAYCGDVRGIALNAATCALIARSVGRRSTEDAPKKPTTPVVCARM